MKRPPTSVRIYECFKKLPRIFTVFDLQKLTPHALQNNCSIECRRLVNNGFAVIPGHTRKVQQVRAGRPVTVYRKKPLASVQLNEIGHYGQFITVRSYENIKRYLKDNEIR